MCIAIVIEGCFIISIMGLSVTRALCVAVCDSWL